MKTGVERVFVDTNVLIYANVAESPFHEAALTSLKHHYETGAELWLSRQVLREYLAVLSRSQLFKKPKSIATLTKRVRFFQDQFMVAEEGPAVTERLLALMDHFPVRGKQVHDANIVATMLANGVTALLTHNVADFEKFVPAITLIQLD